MSRDIQHVFPVMVSEVVPGPDMTQLGRGRNRTSIEMRVINTMREPVFWRNALGMVVKEPSEINPKEEEALYIVIEYHFDSGVKIDPQDMLTEARFRNIKVERERVYEALKTLEQSPRHYKERSFHYTLALTRDELEAQGGVVYLQDVDMVVGFQTHVDTAQHPHTTQGHYQQLNDTLKNEPGIHQRFLLNDNGGRIGSRYINTGYDVFELKPSNDPQLRDGVYVTVKHNGNPEPISLFYSIEEADKALGLYVNRAEAETFGAPEARFKADLKEREQDIEREKLNLRDRRNSMDEEQKEQERRHKQQEEELRQRKARFEEEQRQRQREQERQKEQFEHERKMHEERARFEYDMRSRDRKDNSDALKAAVDIGKAILSVVSLLLSAYTLMKKNTDK